MYREHLQSCSAGNCFLIDGQTFGDCVAICQRSRPVGQKNLCLTFCKVLEKAVGFVRRLFELEKEELRAGLLVKKNKWTNKKQLLFFALSHANVECAVISWTVVMLMQHECLDSLSEIFSFTVDVALLLRQ